MSRSKENGEQIPADFDTAEKPEDQATPERPEYSGGEDVAENPADQAPPETAEQSGGEDAPERSAEQAPEGGGEPDLQTIEEYAEKFKTGKPILAAIMEAEGWAAGKKVTEEVFKTAVETFLNGPMNGERNPSKEINNGTA
jgi:hypothetical protein